MYFFEIIQVMHLKLELVAAVVVASDVDGSYYYFENSNNNDFWTDYSTICKIEQVAEIPDDFQSYKKVAVKDSALKPESVHY